MSKIIALNAKINGTQLALANGWVEEIIKELVTLHTALVLTLQTELACTLLIEWVPEDPNLPIFNTQKVLLILTKQNFEARAIKSLNFSQRSAPFTH